MLNWFGVESWGAPVCRDCPRCDIPVGAVCVGCGKRVHGDDSGVTMPHMGVDAIGVSVFHLNCFLESFLPEGSDDALYNAAREANHACGLPWTDPRTGHTYPPPKQ